MKNKLLFAALFFFIFPPHVIVFGMTIKVVYFSIFIPSILGGVSYLKSKEKKSEIEMTLFLMILSLIYFSLLSIAHGAIDFQISLEIINGLIIFFASLFYVGRYKKIYGDEFPNNICHDLHMAGFVQAIIVILTFLSPAFRESLYSFIGTTETANRYLFMDVEVRRFQGIVPSGFSFLSTTHALLMVCGFWELCEKKDRNLLYLIKFAIMQLTIFLSILLIGRTGIIVILIYTVLVAYILYKQSRPGQDKILHIKYKSIFIISILFALVFLALVLIVDIEYFIPNIEFAFELILNLYNHGALDRTTSGVLESHYFLPDNTFELLFGTGNFGRNGVLEYVDSDVGYIIFITGSGILGLFIAYSFYYVGLYHSALNNKYIPRMSYYLIGLIAVIAIGNAKDYYFISHIGYSQLYFLFFSVLALSNFIHTRKVLH